jgi:hypothetical protein
MIGQLVAFQKMLCTWLFQPTEKLTTSSGYDEDESGAVQPAS